MIRRMVKAYEEARDFTGGEWDGFRPESRYRLLLAHGIWRLDLSKLRWRQLPESVKSKLVRSRMQRTKLNERTRGLCAITK